MPDITIHRHGERWALQEAGAESPTEEFDTREAAELAARDLARGGSVEVREDGPRELDERDRSAGEHETTTDEDVAAVNARERTRSVQTGL
jgi:Uncharacterized protein conserved in bacteria (DUF2188)